MAINSLLINLGQFCIHRTRNLLNSINTKRASMLNAKQFFSEGNDKPSNSQLAEGKIQDVLRKSFPAAEYIEVRDVSGGCGAMFEISIISGQFKGMSIVKQHRMVNEFVCQESYWMWWFLIQATSCVLNASSFRTMKALKEEIKDMHGLRIQTALPLGSSL